VLWIKAQYKCNPYTICYFCCCYCCCCCRCDNRTTISSATIKTTTHMPALMFMDVEVSVTVVFIIFRSVVTKNNLLLLYTHGSSSEAVAPANGKPGAHLNARESKPYVKTTNQRTQSFHPHPIIQVGHRNTAGPGLGPRRYKYSKVHS